MNAQKLRILITGGGSGGHIYPLIAVLETLNKTIEKTGIEAEIHYLGASGRYRFLLASQNVIIKDIVEAKLRRYFSLKNILDAPKLILSVLQAFWQVFWLMPDVLFSKGGPGSLPVVLACAFYRVPIFIHESDSAPGLANRLAGRFAKKIGVAFEATQQFFKNRKTIIFGNPIRENLIQEQLSPEEAKRVLGFNADEPLVLFFGGSLGSTRINEFVLNNLEDLLKEFQILHQTGIGNYEAIRNEVALILKNYVEEEKSRYQPIGFLEKNYKDALTAADLIISRAGGGAIFEIAAFGKPSILIPLKESASDHQKLNAYEYAKTKAAIIIEENNLLPHLFINQIKDLFSHPIKLKQMSEAAKSFAKPEAAEAITNEILNLANIEYIRPPIGEAESNEVIKKDYFS